jgi:signal transduction histidine kinase
MSELNQTPRVYVFDDDPLVCRDLVAELAEATAGGYDISSFTRAASFSAALAQASPDALICGLRCSSEPAVAAAREDDPDLALFFLTRAADGDAAAGAAQELGLLSVVRIPIDMTDLLPKLRGGLERRRLGRANRELRAELEKRDRALQASKRQVETATAKLANTYSELETATERLVQAEQLAAVGRVVTGIAHELDRQLALVGYAEAIKSRVADDPELGEFADIIVHAQKRLAAMVDEIRDFVSSEGARPMEREPADVASVIDEALALMAYDKDVRRRTIECSYRGRPLVALDRQKFSQVVMNLVSNAVLATEPGDVIRIELDADDGAGVALLTVIDQGVGMPGEVLVRLGEPFFTTRGDRGSGLGVGICMRIVEDHGGNLTFCSALGEGTTARIRIPLLDGGTR